MEKLYKLTDKDGYTRKGQKGETWWSEGFTVVKPKVNKPQLCSFAVVHAYRNLNLALLLNPIHASLSPLELWEADGNVVASDWGKVGCSSLTTIKKLNLPEWYTNEESRKKVQIKFAVLCAIAVLPFYEEQYPKDDRPRKAIEAANNRISSYSAADAAAYAAAADAAYAAAADAAADAAAYAADAAAADAADARDSINFEILADKAVDLIVNKGE